MKRGKPVVHPRIVNLETGDVFLTFKEAAEAVGGSRTGVRKCCDGMQKHHKGYHFRYLRDFA